MAELNAALIGQGFMGKAHSNAYAQVGRFFPELPKVRRKVVCGRNHEALAAFAETWGWEGIETDWRRVVERDDVDIVDICTPNYLHAEPAIAAAQAGKMVLCEKPPANNAAEAAAMAAAAQGVPSMVWFNYRRAPAVELARQLVHEGRLGRIFHYRAAYLQQWGVDFTRPAGWRLSKAEAGSGANGDLNSHLIDTAMMLLGPIREVSATMETFFAEKPDPARPGETYPVDVDDAVLAQARFAVGALATFEATRFAVGVGNSNRFEIHGEKGMLRFNLEDLNRLEYVDAAAPKRTQGATAISVTGAEHPYAAKIWRPGHPLGYEHTFIAALADFLAGVESGEPARPTLEDGLAVQRVLDAVETSANERRWVETGL